MLRFHPFIHSKAKTFQSHKEGGKKYGSIPGRKDAGLYRNGKPSFEEYGAVAESEGASLPYALAAEGLGLYNAGPCPDMPGRS